MRRQFVCFLMAVVLLTACFPAAMAQETDLADEDGIRLGFMDFSDGCLTLRLYESASTGYVWKMAPESEYLQAVSDAVVPASEKEVMLGLPDMHVFILKGLAPGRGMLALYFANNWIHGLSAEYTINILYTVENDLSITVAGAFTACGEPIPDTIEEQMFSDPQYGAITFKKELYQIYTGKSVTVSVNASSKDISKKGYTFESSDTNVATVNSEGSVKGIGQGKCTILVTSKNDPRVWARYTVQVMVRVTKVTVSGDTNSLTVGESTQLRVGIEPENADEQGVTWRTSDKSVATVDENGLVTAVGKGNVTISARSKDNEDKSGSYKLSVIQGVAGVTAENAYIRVGHRNNYKTVTVSIKPSNANNKNMTWYSSDESIATVTGTKNECRVTGHAWGQAEITGVTEDGHYTVSFIALVGNLARAVLIKNETLNYYGEPEFILENESDKNISCVHVVLKAWDYYGNPVVLSYDENDPYSLTGDYNMTLCSGSMASSRDIQYRYKLQNGWDGIAYIRAAVTGWECAEGYLTSSGTISNRYGLGEDSYDWVEMGTKPIGLELQ